MEGMYGAIRQETNFLQMDNQILTDRCNELSEILGRYNDYATNIMWRIDQEKLIL